MKAAILPNLTRKDCPKVTAEICRCLAGLNASVYLPEEFKDDFPIPGIVFIDEDEAIRQCDAVIAVGGDGSIIHAAKRAVEYRKPVLGVNSGRLAFMAGLENDELHLLSRLIDGSYYLDKRLMLKTTVFRGDEVISSDFCLNECLVTNEEKQRMSVIDVALNGNTFNGYLCDGVIVATPTGSTAYSLSAGGPVVDPELESILFTPLCPHSLVARSIIFKPKDIISVSSGDGVNLICSNDGGTPVTISPDCRVEISSADFTADFIRIKSDNFIDILYKKLAQRR